MTRVAMVVPGSGSHGRSSVGSLDPNHPRVEEADAFRRDAGLPTLSELDGAARFEPEIHAQPIHAIPLAYLIGVLQAEGQQRGQEAVAVVGSSIGWYTALAIAGVLSFGDGLRLVHELATAHQQRPAWAQVVYPLTDAAWRPQPALRAALDAALAASGGDASLLLDLGAFAVVGGPSAALDHWLPALRPVLVDGQRYPRRITGRALHGPGVPDLPAATVQHAAALHWQQPGLTLIDGRGARHAPWSADPGELRDYTLSAFQCEPYRFATALRVALREYAPDALLLLGAGRSLANAAGQIVVAEGYHGLRTRAAYAAVQAGSSPVVLGVAR